MYLLVLPLDKQLVVIDCSESTTQLTDMMSMRNISRSPKLAIVSVAPSESYA